MRAVTFSMSMSLDGFIVGPDGSFDFPGFDEEIFRISFDEVRLVDVHLMGRKLYETMLYWEDPARSPDFDESEREWAELWNPLPKVVFSRTLTEVKGNARLATGGVAEEIARLRAEPGGGEIAIGGADIAAQAADAGLIDEYKIRVFPVLVGGGIPFFSRNEQRVELELLESRTFSSKVLYLHYRVVR